MLPSAPLHPAQTVRPAASRTGRTRLALLLLLLLATAGLACGGPSEAAWRLELDGEASTPALGRDGSIIVVTTAPSLLSVSAEGKVRWSIPLQGSVPYYDAPIDGPIGPMVLGDGDIIAPLSATSVARYSPDGELRWRAELPQALTAGFATMPDGSVMAACKEATLVHIGPQGTIRLVFRDNSGSGSSPWTAPPVILDDGSLVGVLGTSRVVRIAPDGTQLFSYPVPGMTNAVALGPDQSIIYVSRIGSSSFGGVRGVVALSPEGTVRWSSPLPEGAEVEAVVGADGVVHAVSVAGGGTSKLLRTASTGPQQEVALSANALTGPLLGADGSRIVRTRDDFLTVIDRDGETVEFAVLPAWRTPPVLDAGGALFATAGRELLRIQVSVDALASGGWARPRGDNRSSGTVTPGN
jgi:PQQ-like domain